MAENNGFAWDPKQYLAFNAPRMRPAQDLLLRIPVSSPAEVVDLGCGPGNSTALLAERFPNASITGIDLSDDMLRKARASRVAANWQQGDIADWTSDGQGPDLIFSNAALQWVPDHPRLLPYLLEQVQPGGILAVQMPNNYQVPALRLIVELANQHACADLLRPHLREKPILDAAAYYDLLAPKSVSLDIWETEYLHVLEGENPVLDWTKGTALRPVLNALPSTQRQGFEDLYASAVQDAYPRRSDGTTLYPFRRLFLIACRRR